MEWVRSSQFMARVRYDLRNSPFLQNTRSILWMAPKWVAHLLWHEPHKLGVLAERWHYLAVHLTGMGEGGHSSDRRTVPQELLRADYAERYHSQLATIYENMKSRYFWLWMQPNTRPTHSYAAGDVAIVRPPPQQSHERSLTRTRGAHLP